MDGVRALDTQGAKLEPIRVLAALGYPAAECASAAIREMLPALIDEVAACTIPKAVVRSVTFETSGGAIQIACGPVFHAPFLAYAAALASRVCLFALTLGPAVTDWISDLAARDVAAGFVADAAASEWVEVLADRLQAELAAELASEGLAGVSRFCPGYCDWPIEQMPALLGHVDAATIGITLSEGGLMIPRKSICGLIAFGRDVEEMDRLPCDVCAKDCPHRRAPHRPRRIETAP